MATKKKKISKPVMKRNRKQYTAFRNAFMKWFKGYEVKSDSAKMTTESFTFYKSGKKVATYFAPDYTRYMKWIGREYL